MEVKEIISKARFRAHDLDETKFSDFEMLEA